MNKQIEFRLSLFLCIAVAWLLVFTQAHAQTTPAPAYPNSKLVWDYEWTVPGGGFPVQVDGKWVKRVATDLRELPFSELNLTEGTHRIEIRARAADGRVSDPAGIDVDYRLAIPEPLPMPSTIRIQMEWEVEE